MKKQYCVKEIEDRPDIIIILYYIDGVFSASMEMPRNQLLDTIRTLSKKGYELI